MQRLMTLAEVAELLRLPPATLRTWRYRGRGPRALKVGRHLRYRPDDVEAWLAQQGDDEGRVRPSSGGTR